MNGAPAYDAIIIGAGSNGLAAAGVLARAGRRVLVIERGDDVGGQSRALEFAPGFRAPLSSFDTGWVPPMVARGIGIGSLPMDAPDISVTAVAGAGDALVLSTDPARAAAAIRTRSPRDAERWAAFTHRLHKLAGFLEALYQLPPPDVDTTSLADIVPLLSLGRKFRALGRADMGELLRVLPMPVQDLLDDWFENSLLKAAVGAGAARDIRQGPRSGGTAFVLLHYLTGAAPGSVRARAWWRDGPDTFALFAAAAAAQHGTTVRTAATVARILVRDDSVTGVVLENGEEIAAPLVLSTADPAHTLLGMVDPVWLDPEFLHAVGNVKFRGCTAMVRYALDALPGMPGVEHPTRVLAGIVSLTPSLDALERAYDAAKYGATAHEPHVEFTVPTLRWPSLAPEGKHVLVARAQYTPHTLAGGAQWDAPRTASLGAAVTAAIARALPGFDGSVRHQDVLTPRDLERRFGMTQGALTGGELTLDQILFMRPVGGHGGYRMPIAGLYLGGSGAHPGPGVLGAAGWLAARRALADTARPRR